MSRVANKIIEIPTGVTITLAPGQVTVKGAKGALSLPVSEGVSVAQQDKNLTVKYADEGASRTRAGSTRAHIANMITGVTKGYERKLELVGVGFRAAVAGKTLNLTLGFSHPVALRSPLTASCTVEALTSTLPPSASMICAYMCRGVRCTVSLGVPSSRIRMRVFRARRVRRCFFVMFMVGS